MESYPARDWRALPSEGGSMSSAPCSSRRPRAHIFSAQLLQRGGAVLGIVDVLKSKLFQKVADDTDHRIVVVDDEDRHRQVNRHDPLPFDNPNPLGSSAS